MALRWKGNFIREGAYLVRIYCYNTENVPLLLDANELAEELGLNTIEDVGKRHYHEYLAFGWISGSECAGVFQFTK